MTNPGWGHTAGGGGQPPQPRCVRHPDRPTLLSCSRCGRPACPDCLLSAAVGHQCVECVAATARYVPRARTVAGAAVRTQTATALVTYLLIAVNTAIFAVTVAQSGSVTNNQSGSSLFLDWALVPAWVAAGGEYIRVLGSGFLHFGILHLAVNMFALYVVGRDIEYILGRIRYLAVYLVSLLGGSAAVMLLSEPLSATAGASGAVFGLLGAQAVILVRMRHSPAPVLMIVALNIVISVTIPGISLWGHLGGLTAGAAATAALVFAPRWPGAGDDRARIGRAGWLALGAVAVVTLLLVVLAVLRLRAQLGV